jgi:hypothetical protein
MPAPNPIPNDPLELLTQRESITALRAAMRPDAAAALEQGGASPAYRMFNGSRLYCWRDLLTWADAEFPDYYWATEEPQDPEAVVSEVMALMAKRPGAASNAAATAQ